MRALIVACLAGCSFEPGALGASDANDAPADAEDDAPPDGTMIVDPTAWLPGYTYRKTISIDPDGAVAALTDVPIGIRFNADTDIAAHARTDGADLVITTSDGTTVVASELAWYGASGSGELWVKLSSLQLDTTTTLYLYFGGPVTLSTPTAVWTNGFKGVWHLSTNVGLELESTANQNHVTQAVLTANPGTSPGVGGIGRSRLFDGTDDVIGVADPVDGSLDVGTASFTVSIWVRALGPTGLYDQSLYKGGTNPGNPGYTVFTGTNLWTGKILDETGNNFINPQFQTGGAINGWMHLVMVIDRETATNRWFTYRDGAPVTNQTFTLSNFNGTAALQIGGSGTSHFNGSIDEVRVYGRVVDANWVKTEYDNFRKVDFLVFGPLQMN